ncbi:MAG: 4'-phosphopantetheinyl transferase superfamily protein [Oscillospiraceae bacterium]|nr:4'-phosphopantetheinyl transferase superfamily protein [Oscillospiraceae bacterium]
MNNWIIAGEALSGRSGHEAGRALLARLYRQHFGGEMPEILREPGGKPYFSTGNIHFSITHTKAHVFCALADHPIGIDAEELTRPVKESLAQRVLSPGEYAQYGAAADKNRAFLTFWVLKEAAAKATGEGIRGFPNKTDFSLNDPRVQEIDGCLVAVVEIQK